MKIFINIVAILALVVTTGFASSASNAMPGGDAKIVKSEFARVQGCHGHKAKSDSHPISHSNKDPSGKCCDKGACKCVGGACHSLSKLFGEDAIFIIIAISEGERIMAADESGDSALLSRLKRPPRA